MFPFGHLYTIFGGPTRPSPTCNWSFLCGTDMIIRHCSDFTLSNINFCARVLAAILSDTRGGKTCLLFTSPNLKFCIYAPLFIFWQGLAACIHLMDSHLYIPHPGQCPIPSSIPTVPTMVCHGSSDSNICTVTQVLVDHPHTCQCWRLLIVVGNAQRWKWPA